MKLDIGKKAKISVNWNVSPYDYSAEKVNSIAVKASRKFGVHRNRVKVIPNFITSTEEGDIISVSKDVIQNIQNSEFQVSLFKKYLETRGIEGYNFEIIKSIDADINNLIDYQVYDKYRRYSIKWIKWDNFLSYGEGNMMDFSKLGKLVLLSGEPANQSGKTTFAIDLIRFLLFGKTTKAATQDKIFNKHLDEATTVTVEGCITINGEDYIIKRTLSRPSLSKRTSKSKTTQKVEYYKVNGETMEELVEDEDLTEESSTKTNIAIKEAIGKESDFELVMSVTESTLDDLVNKKDAERGRLLSRWIGLLPLEEKDRLARERFNSEVKPNLLSNRYSIDGILSDIESISMTSKGKEAALDKVQKEILSIDDYLKQLEKTRETLLSAKLTVDPNISSIDITTLTRQIENVINDGNIKKNQLKEQKEELEKMGDVEFSNDEYDKTSNLLSEETSKLTLARERYRTISKSVEDLKKGEICPTCGRKLDNVDNSARIAELERERAELLETGNKANAEVNALKGKLEALKIQREKYERRSRLLISSSALEVSVEKLRSDYKELNEKKKDYQRNAESIDKNNKIDIELRNTDSIIRSKRIERDHNVNLVAEYKSNIKAYESEIEEKKKLIQQITKEEEYLKNWKIYLELVGRNGISKMVLRETLPIINAKLAEMLDNVCDFNVEVEITDKSEIIFSLIKDGVKSDLSSGSGFELTAAALALRAVLSEMSTIPMCSTLVLDELWGRVAKENYDNMKSLIEKVARDFNTVFLISHLEEARDWCDENIVIKKENNVSRITSAR